MNFIIFMKLKQIPKDFIVDEIFDLKKLNLELEDVKKPYYYFKLTKINYNQLDAILKVAKIFNTSKKLVHFAGTKDKVGITSQLISIYGIDENNFEKNLEFLNQKIKDLNLEFLGKFNSRVNLGNNLGNHFKIVIRDLDENQILKAKNNVEKIEKTGILNFFDSQRFGYANNSNIVGKYVLQNNIELAVKEILTSIPKENFTLDLKEFVDFINLNWEEIKNCNENIIDNAITICPNFLRKEKKILEHLKKYKNDFPGSFRTIHKKLRTLYVGAYQSFVFNKILEEFCVLDNLDLENDLELELVNSNSCFDDFLNPIVNKILEKDNLSFDNFNLKHMPELKFVKNLRKVKIFPKNIQILEILEDDLNLNKKKLKISFDLGSGEYATNVIKQLFL